MTKALLPIVLVFVASLSASCADDITLADGTVLKNAKIVQQDDSTKTVTISFSGGVAQVHSEMVPATLSTAQPPAVTNAASQSTSVPVSPTPPPSTQGPEDWTVNWKTYRNVKVTMVEADKVHVTFDDDGVGTFALADLTPDLQKRFNYDPAKATAQQQQREAAMDEEMQKAAQEHSAQTEATRLANRPKVYLMGEVLQKVPGVGLLVDCEMPEVEADSSASIGGGGNVYIPQTGCPKGVNQVYGKFMLTGYPNEVAVVDGAAIRTVAFANGTYSYTTVAGANATVASYTALLPKH